MSYTIGQVAELTGLSIHTLRYYEKEGILPSVMRSSSGMRSYVEKDLEALEFIGCLRAIGMTIADIKHFVQESTTIDQRLLVLEKQKETVNAQINQLVSYQSMIHRKIALYMNMRKEVNSS
ncbi:MULTISPECIES: MerR family transcriptional regulator [Paenibacillus]|uniref:MerR family transcriptional regulator n=1 Tax=Paenibacillus TaxID=44249 RepID=UPI0022B93AAC|nr:MerR family transcriptional regulator [Paenibacillus caseinilyticus]MCZ8521379.1 MerR family transcriptional regulator [Paenibacillus caseinilyticus]